MALNTEICRICLTIIQTKIDINDVYENTYHLIDLIHEVYSEELEICDALPQYVCTECASKLVDCHRFRALVIASHEKLKNSQFKQISNETNIAFIDMKYTADNRSSNCINTNSEQQFIDSDTHILLKDEPVDVAYLDDEECSQYNEIDDKSALSASHDRNPSCRSTALDVKSVTCLFKCLLCSAKLHSELSLKKHLKYVHKSTTETAISAAEHEAELETLFANAKRLICDKCNRSFAKRSAFLKHYRYVHLKDLFRSKFNCPLCPRLFSGTGNTSNIQRHIKTVHQKNSHMSKGQIVIEFDDNDDDDEANKYYDNTNQLTKCNDCDDCFSNSIDLYEHSKIHNLNCNETADGYNLECDECHLMYATLDDFSHHMTDVHRILSKKCIRPIKCHWCGERFVRVQGLYSHIRYAHHFNKYDESANTVRDPVRKIVPTAKQNSCLCTICGKFLSTSVALSTHLLIHSNVRPFTCNVCNATFRQYNTLYIHKTIHTNERKYRCKECSKMFRQNAHLKTHLKTHGIGIDRWHACTICEKKFYSKGNLSVHMWVHKSGHPFQCMHCSKGFARKNKLEAHMKKEHTFN